MFVILTVLCSLFYKRLHAYPLPLSQYSPTKPSVQLQLNVWHLWLATQVPPFWHGEDRHAVWKKELMSDWNQANKRFKSFENYIITGKLSSPWWNNDARCGSSCSFLDCRIFQKKAIHTIAFHQQVWMQPSSKKDRMDCWGIQRCNQRCCTQYMFQPLAHPNNGTLLLWKRLVGDLGGSKC